MLTTVERTWEGADLVLGWVWVMDQVSGRCRSEEWYTTEKRTHFSPCAPCYLMRCPCMSHLKPSPAQPEVLAQNLQRQRCKVVEERPRCVNPSMRWWLMRWLVNVCNNCLSAGSCQPQPQEQCYQPVNFIFPMNPQDRAQQMAAQWHIRVPPLVREATEATVTPSIPQQQEEASPPNSQVWLLGSLYPRKQCSEGEALANSLLPKELALQAMPLCIALCPIHHVVIRFTAHSWALF